MKKLLISLLSVLMVFSLAMPLRAEGPVSVTDSSGETKTYSSISGAISGTTDSEFTIDVNETISSSSNFVIPNGKTITLDLNGNGLSFDSEDLGGVASFEGLSKENKTVENMDICINCMYVSEQEPFSQNLT